MKKSFETNIQNSKGGSPREKRQQNDKVVIKQQTRHRIRTLIIDGQHNSTEEIRY